MNAIRLCLLTAIVALGGDVGEIHVVKVDQLQPRGADGRQLQGHLAADGPYADHRGPD